jgi:hypothetical protein
MEHRNHKQARITKKDSKLFSKHSNPPWREYISYSSSFNKKPSHRILREFVKSCEFYPLKKSEAPEEISTN